MTLNAYRISQDDDKRLDGENHFDSAVVVAESENAARRMRPSFIDHRGWCEALDTSQIAEEPDSMLTYDQTQCWTKDIDDVSVELIGPVTNPKITKPCLIMSHYNGD